MERVRAARSDDRWEAAYALGSEMMVPGDFLMAWEKHPGAKVFFKTQSGQNVYTIAYRPQTTSKPETQQKRFEKFFTMLQNGEKVGIQVKSSDKWISVFAGIPMPRNLSHV